MRNSWGGGIFLEVERFTDLILGNPKKHQIVQSKLEPFLILRKLVREKLAQKRNFYLMMYMRW